MVLGGCRSFLLLVTTANVIVVIKLEMPSYSFGSTYYEFCFTLLKMQYP